MAADGDATNATAVRLLDGPYVVDGGCRVDPPEGSKRLLAFVALHPGGLERRVVAGTLWPLGDDGRAAGNLRSALWRLRAANIDVVESDKWTLRLRAGTVVDLRLTLEWAARVVEDRMRVGDLATTLWRSPAELLPGWREDWVLFERERLRQRLLHGIEALSRRLVDSGHYEEGIEVARAAIAMDPLRESARHVLTEAYLAAGDRARASRLRGVRHHVYPRPEGANQLAPHRPDQENNSPGLHLRCHCRVIVSNP